MPITYQDIKKTTYVAWKIFGQKKKLKGYFSPRFQSSCSTIQIIWGIHTCMLQRPASGIGESINHEGRRRGFFENPHYDVSKIEMINWWYTVQFKKPSKIMKISKFISATSPPTMSTWFMGAHWAKIQNLLSL